MWLVVLRLAKFLLVSQQGRGKGKKKIPAFKTRLQFLGSVPLVECLELPKASSGAAKRGREVRFFYKVN